MKKLFTLLLAVAANVGTMFAEPVQIGDLYYNLDATNQTAQVTSQNSSFPKWSTTITTANIPASVEYNSVTYSVTSIGNNAFYECSGLTSVNIPNSVTSIGNYAFRDCSGLTSVTIPNSVTSIGDQAFYGCSGLTSVTIPNSVTSIGYGAFQLCRSLTSITIPNSVTSIENYAFSNCTGLTSVTIPNSVTSIGDGAFANCKGLTSITIGNSVTSIGSSAFRGCSSLTSIIIPNSVTSIGSSAFYECTALTSITIPNSVTSIGSEAFYGCRSLPVIDNIRYADTYLVAAVDKSLSTYTIKQGTMWIGHYAFSGCSGLTSVTIPNSVTSIEAGAFWGCSGLTSVTIPNSVTSIEYYAFSNCSGLTSVTIPNGVTSIGYGAFYGCSGLTSVTIGNSVTSIGHGAFYGCSGLTSVTIGNSVTSIENGAFYDCSSLTSIIIPNSVTSIESEAFYGCSNLNIIYSVPATRPTISYDTFKGIASDAVVYVSNDAVSNYKSSSSSNYWASMNIIGMEFFNVDKSETATSVTLTTTAALWEITASYIVSIGVEGGEQQPGNTLEYIGLEPESEYKDVPIVLTSNTGETETVKVSFTTTALELTTKASKPVSGTTAILLAETNMADAEVSCGFEYKRNDAPADMDGTKVYCPVASGQMAGRLKNLKDDVYYKYRAFYQSQAGNMYYGDWQYIFTGDVAVEFDPILYTYGATVVKENEATISGYALAGSEDFTEQGFEYWAESRVGGSANGPARMPAALNEHFFVQASGIALRATLTDLDAGTVYKYRVYGKVGDQYYYGSEQTFTTQGTYEGDDSEAIEEVQSDSLSGIRAQKILRDGQIFILRGEKVYTVTGQVVK